VSRPIIEVSNLSKVYRLGEVGASSLREEFSEFWLRLRGQATPPSESEFWALHDVSFTVQPGEVVGIIGRNGAGKSTLLKILSRITEPTSGRAVMRGRVASLLEVGTGFHPDLSGRDNIFLNGAILGMTRAEIRGKFDEIVAFAEVDKFIDTPVKRYSSGMYVRLAFAVAAHLEPEILIVDEVLSVGDASFQRKCLGKMGTVAKGGRTILFVSHNLAAVKSLCTRAILLNSGRLAIEGKTDAVAREYLHGGEKTIWEASWPDRRTAPGNESVWLQRVSVVPESGDDPAHVSIASPLKIMIEFANSVPGAVLNLSLVLNTEEDLCVLNTCSAARATPKGSHQAECRIPGNFLNDESYSLRLLIVQDTSRVLLDVDRVLTFELHETGRQGNWFGKWVGVVRPEFPWTTRLMDTATINS